MSLEDDIRALLMPETYLIMCTAHQDGFPPLLVSFDIDGLTALALGKGWVKTTDGWQCCDCARKATDGHRNDDEPAQDAGSDPV